MKIYNKKRFLTGLFFLLLSVLSVSTLISSFNNGKEFIYILKKIIDIIVSLLIGLSALLTSINKKLNKEADLEESDERNNLIELSAGNTSNKIMFFVYWVMTILFIILWSKYKIDELLIPLIILGLLITISFICNIVSLFYYDKKL